MDKRQAAEAFAIILFAVILLTLALQSIKPSLVVIIAVVAILLAAIGGVAAWLARKGD